MHSVFAVCVDPLVKAGELHFPALAPSNSPCVSAAGMTAVHGIWASLMGWQIVVEFGGGKRGRLFGVLAFAEVGGADIWDLVGVMVVIVGSGHTDTDHSTEWPK